MGSESKIRIFLIAVVLTVMLSSCNKKNDVIPDVTVDFTLDINDAEFVNLSAIGGAISVDARTNNWGIYAAGYDGNGIIIYRADEELFYAYDRTCPHDYEISNLSIKVNIDPEFSIFAICPKCGTKYALSAGGTPVSGIGRYPLKNYKTSFVGGYVRVWN